MNSKSRRLKGKIIRDAVHGDISLESKFIGVIDTPEFQRLRRIRQLSTAYFVFPTAEHSRFSHSIGTYQVMKLIIDHFKGIFEELNLPLDERSIDKALAVSLLHDIGHGPFSHAFEEALPKEKYKKEHEQWTIDIIKSPTSNIYKALVCSFDEQFPIEVAALIKKERDVKHKRNSVDNSKGIDLFFVLSSLISSQLDADRMDYLLRDAFFSGVTYGRFDVERLVKALTVTVNADKYYVCVQEKYLPTIEEYLLARYQMHDSVYYHPFKVQTEIIVKKILQRAFDLHCEKSLDGPPMPKALALLFEGYEISVEDYVTLDDSMLMALFNQWKGSNDVILSTLCLAFLDRNKFKELNILNNSESDLNAFKSDLLAILKRYGYPKNDLDKEYFWISKTSKNVVYKTIKDNIWVLRNNGTLADLTDISNIVHDRLNKEIHAVYINVDMLKMIAEIKDNASSVEREVESLINMFNSRNHIEIEKKYYFKDPNIFVQLLDKLHGWGKYTIDRTGIAKLQVDTYYDTAGKMLYSTNRTLRIRDSSGKHALTIKMPTSSDDKRGTTVNSDQQNERFEYEIGVAGTRLSDAKEYINKYLPDIKMDDPQQALIKTLVINNNREKIMLGKDNILFEMVFDDVTYQNPTTSQSCKEYQVEIELKSDFSHRVNLKHLTDYIDELALGLNPTTESKYKRGYVMTEL